MKLCPPRSRTMARATRVAGRSPSTQKNAFRNPLAPDVGLLIETSGCKEPTAKPVLRKGCKTSEESAPLACIATKREEELFRSGSWSGLDLNRVLSWRATNAIASSGVAIKIRSLRRRCSDSPSSCRQVCARVPGPISFAARRAPAVCSATTTSTL